MMYLPEIKTGHIYTIDGVDYTVINIRVTNVISKYSFITGIVLKNEKHSFETSAYEMINNPKFVRKH